MAQNKVKAQQLEQKNKIFISWSGKNSKEIAKGIKSVFENKIFTDELTCFVSDIDISSGADWWNKIKEELNSSKLGIICITKENINAPWIYFEAGAMITHNIPVIPLLINCNTKTIADTPLKGNQCVDFHDQQKFIKMILDINKRLNLLQLKDAQLEPIAKESYIYLRDTLSSVLTELKNLRIFNDKYVYPKHITTVEKKTIFISAPMASINSKDYTDLRKYLINLKKTLTDIGFLKVVCPMIDKANPKKFDGKTKAIKDNFSNLKKVDCMIVIYPQKTPSSLLVEIGYGLALSKRMVIFYKEGLPYILEKAGETIEHITTQKITKLSDIGKHISANGFALFEGENDE